MINKFYKLQKTANIQFSKLIQKCFIVSSKYQYDTQKIKLTIFGVINYFCYPLYCDHNYSKKSLSVFNEIKKDLYKKHPQHFYLLSTSILEIENWKRVLLLTPVISLIPGIIIGGLLTFSI